MKPVDRATRLLLARGGLIAFLDFDDLWSPESLGSQIQHLEKELHAQYGGSTSLKSTHNNQNLMRGLRESVLRKKLIPWRHPAE